MSSVIRNTYRSQNSLLGEFTFVRPFGTGQGVVKFVAFPNEVDIFPNMVETVDLIVDVTAVVFTTAEVDILLVTAVAFKMVAFVGGMHLCKPENKNLLNHKQLWRLELHLLINSSTSS